MTLYVDDEAEQTFARVIYNLRSERRNAGLSQGAISCGMSVRSRALSEWETGTCEPTLPHLMQWSRQLDLRLVIVDRYGEYCSGNSGFRDGGSWEIFERRCLAAPLRRRRAALGLTQEELAQMVGASRDSISRWELALVPPRPIALIVWAQKLGRSIDLRRVAPPKG